MALFSDPVVLNDGSADHSFSFRAQLPDKKNIAGEWIEPSAELSSQSKITVKHDSSNPSFKRRLLQRTVQLPITDGTLKTCTVNLTITHHQEHTAANITKQLKILTDATNETNFAVNFLMGLI